MNETYKQKNQEVQKLSEQTRDEWHYINGFNTPKR